LLHLVIEFFGANLLQQTEEREERPGSSRFLALHLTFTTDFLRELVLQAWLLDRCLLFTCGGIKEPKLTAAT